MKSVNINLLVDPRISLEIGSSKLPIAGYKFIFLYFSTKISKFGERKTTTYFIIKPNGNWREWHAEALGREGGGGRRGGPSLQLKKTGNNSGCDTYTLYV